MAIGYSLRMAHDMSIRPIQVKVTLYLGQKRALKVNTRDTYYAHTEAKFLELGSLFLIFVAWSL